MSLAPAQRAVVHLDTDTHGDELRRADDPRYVIVPGHYVILWPIETLAGPFEDAETANDWANEGGNGGGVS